MALLEELDIKSLEIVHKKCTQHLIVAQERR